MPRNYATVSPRFWTGETGRALRAEGRDVQLLALYLITSPHANMIGLYYLPLPLAGHEIGMDLVEVTAAMHGAEEAGFCQYDWEGAVVFVPEMARHQLGAALGKGDKRRKGVVSMLLALTDSPLAVAFAERYATAYDLGSYAEIARGLEGAWKGSRRGLEGWVEKPPKQLQAPEGELFEARDVSKGPRSQRTENREQRTEEEVSAADAAERPKTKARKPRETPFNPDVALMAVAKASRGRVVFSKPKAGHCIAVWPLIKDHPELAIWELVGEYLAPPNGNEKHLEVLGTPQLVAMFDDLYAKAKAWDQRGRQPLGIAKPGNGQAALSFRAQDEQRVAERSAENPMRRIIRAPRPGEEPEVEPVLLPKAPS
jgi:hypothetical protein